MRSIIVGGSYSAYFMLLEEPFLSFGKAYRCLLGTAVVFLTLPSHWWST